jgi:predicted dienelactone hydrolase
LLAFTKQSAVNPDQVRVLETVIWYPAPPGSGPLEPTYAAAVDAPLADSAGPYPLVLFSHGTCSHPVFSTFLLAFLSSHGFVVAAPSHAGNTGFDSACAHPNCDPGCEPMCGAASLADSLVERPRDVGHVLDEMLAAGADPGSPFHGAIDSLRIGVAGHSLGGYTASVAAMQDSRFKVAAATAPAAFLLPPTAPGLAIPSLTVLFELDCVLGPLLTNPPMRDAYNKAQPPKFLVEIGNANHTAMLDSCASFSVCGFPMCGFPGSVCESPELLTQAEAHDAVRRWFLPFLKVYLAGDLSFRPFLTPPAGPGFVFDAVP